MADPIVIAVSLSSRTWRGELQRHVRDHVADLVVVPVRDGIDCADRSPHVILLDDDTSWLSVPFLTKAREAGSVVVGLFDPDEADGHGHNYLQRLGVDYIKGSDVSSLDLVEFIRSIRPLAGFDDRFAALASVESSRLPTDRRRLVSVGGPAGAGATEVAVALARLWSAGRPLLIDIDETHPTLARRLGLGIHPHLITAIETLRGERSALTAPADDHIFERATLADCVARRAVDGPPIPFDVIAGLASRDDWSLVRPDELGELLDEASARWPVVIARLGPQLEDLSRYVDRYELSRSVARRSERVIGVCDATATGVLRFIDWLVDALTLIGDTPVDVVLNRAPRSASIRGQITQQLRDIAGDRIGEIVTVPTDRKIERAAWEGNVATGGAFNRALAPLCSAIESSATERSAIGSSAIDDAAGPTSEATVVESLA